MIESFLIRPNQKENIGYRLLIEMKEVRQKEETLFGLVIRIKSNEFDGSDIKEKRWKGIPLRSEF